MRSVVVVIFTCVAVVCGACASSSPASEAATANAGIDSLNARLSNAYRTRDPAAYSALFTDSAVFEWPAIAPVRGPIALGAMAREIWAPEHDVELRVRVSSRRLANDHATEFGAFEQTWSDSAGVRRSEFGRYAALAVRRPDGSWRFERWLGFEDSTAVKSNSPVR